MTNEIKTPKRTYKKCKFSIIEDAQKRLGLADAELGYALGYDKTVVGHWRKTGEAPAVAGLAAEALVRRNGSRIEQPRLYMLKLTEEERLAVEPILKMARVTLVKVEG